MTDQRPEKELRIKGGSAILDYLRRFSSTEKAVFGSLVVLALVTALIMVDKVNSYFMVDVPTSGGIIHEGIVGLPRNINPVLAITDADRDLSALVYAGLMRYENGQFVPDIAQSYSVSGDGLTYDFILRTDARFQDGTPLTADDVAFTIAKIQDPAMKSPRAADWANVTVKEVSPNEIQFILKQPYSPFIANTAIGIIPKHIWNAVSDGQFIFSSYNMSPVGAGPYKIGSIVRDSGGIPTEYRLTTWGGYYGEQPYVATLAFDFFADEDTALAALDSGSIDSLASVSPADAARLATDSAEGYVVLKAPLPWVFGVFLNQSQNPILADKSVRQALDMSVDRSAIVSDVLDGYGSPLEGPLPPGLSTSTDAYEYPDLADAQTLLAADGWKKDPVTGIYGKKSGKNATTTLAFTIDTADTPDLKQAAEMVKDQWTALGASVAVQIFEPGDLYQNVISTRKYDALLFGEEIGKDRDLYAFWHSSQRNAPGLNVAMYTSSKADSLLESIRGNVTDAVRAADYSQFDQLVRTDLPAIFLYAPDFIYVVPRTLHDISLGSIATPSDRFDSVCQWYIETERVWKIFAK